jgi:HEPN domain-containing protein
MATSTDQLLNDFAIRSFRDIADGDYISARMACRARLAVQYLWASQQAVEKYLKCILLLHRIPAKEMEHDLSRGLSAIHNTGSLTLGLTKPTEEFVSYLDDYGAFRYLEVSHHAFGTDIVRLDRTVWELRRFCTLAPEPRTLVLSDGAPAPKQPPPKGGGVAWRLKVAGCG